jgi:hypothetical protein
MSLLSLGSDIAALFQKTPNAPAAPNVNVQGDQAAAIKANTANLPASENLSSDVNSFNYSQLHDYLTQAIPGYSSIVNQEGNLVSQELSGQLPSGVVSQIQSSANAAATAGGYGQSGMSGNLTARDLGLNSLQMTQQGLSSAESWMKNTSSMAIPALSNVSNMFLSPEQVISNDWANQTAQYNQSWLSNQLSAYKSNQFTQALGNLGNDAESAALMAAGGGMGGAAGAGMVSNSVNGGSPGGAGENMGVTMPSGGSGGSSSWMSALSSIFGS